MLTVSLITIGSPEQLTGGYLYHRRMTDFAPAHDAAIEFVSFPTLPFPLPAAAGNRVLRQAERAGVVVVDSLAAAFVAPWRLPHPAAAILHQPPGGIDNGAVRRELQKRLDKIVYRRCQLLIFASQALVADASDKRTVVIPPGSDVSGAPARPLPALRQGRRVAFLSVGNWIPRKGALELLTAFARLPDDAATLHLVGRTDQDRRYAARVRCRLARPDLADRVVVHGPLPPEEVARLYAAADAFVLASYREPYGTVYGEALAAGLPVVGWRAGNLPNLAEDGREGIVVKPDDLTGLVAGLERLAFDDEYRTRLAASARKRGGQLTSWEETASRFFAVLKQLAGTSP